MSNTITAPGTNKAGEAVTIEIPIPDANRVEDWNAAIREGYEKAGAEIPGGEAKPAAAAATTEPPKKDEPTEYRAKLNVNGTEMEFVGKDAGDVLNQYSAAVEAARLAAAPPVKKEEEKKGLTEAELFDIGVKLQKGDVSGIKDYLLKSDLVGEYLAAQGVDVAKLKAATEKTQSDTVLDAWTRATNEFKAKVAAGEVDYVASPQNMKMMGYTIARLGLQPSVDNMIKAWQEMKKDGLVFPAEKEEKKTGNDPAPKTAPSSTAIGTAGAGKDAGKPTIDPNRRWEIDMNKMTVAQASEQWNSLLAQGVKPEQINVIR